MIHPDDAEDIGQRFSNLVAGNGSKVNSFYRIVNPDGEWIWVHVLAGTIEQDGEKRATRIHGTIQNVTEAFRSVGPLRSAKRFLAAGTETAKMLMETTGNDFDKDIFEILDTLGKASRTDRVFLCKFSRTEGEELILTKTYSWSREETHLQDMPKGINVLCSKTVPFRLETLISGNCITGLTRNLPSAEREHLLSLGIISELVAPILLDGKLWGIVGLGECKHERIWAGVEIEMLSNIGFLVSKTIKRLNTEQHVWNHVLEANTSLLVITTNDVVKWMNKSFADMIDINIGDSAVSIYADPAVRAAILDEIMEKGSVTNRIILCRDKKGAVRHLLATYQRIEYEEQPSLLGWMADITAMKKNESDLVLSRSFAESEIKSQNEFLSRMTHEIRTPMNAIMGMTHLCLQTDLNDRQKDYLQKAQAATSGLLGIINEMFDYSEIKAGKLDLQDIPFQVSSLFEEVVNVVQFMAHEKGLRFHAKIDESFENDVLGDPLRIKQILFNLLDNAIKFTEKGEVRIHVRSANVTKTCEKMKCQCLRFSIIDTGIGIAPEQIEKLFLPFTQADTSITRKYGGTGLGLTITRTFVSLMGGTIEVESLPGWGTTFHVTVCVTKKPLAFGKTAVENFEEKENRRTEIRGSKILLVDDNKINQIVASQLLQSLGIEVCIANNGLEAVQAVNERDFDLILMDIQMPVMDGWTATREIRKLKKPNIERLPILALTANTTTDDHQKCMEAGMDDYLSKPIAPEKLNRLLETWLLGM